MLEYLTIEQAAREALIAVYRCGGQKYECGTALYKLDNGNFAFLPPVTSHRPFGVEIGYLAAPPPAGATLVADAHQHICDRRNRVFAQFFSPADALVDQGFHIIGYMLDTCTGLVHRYDSSQDDADDEEVDLVSGKKFYLTIGHISDWIPPDMFVYPTPSGYWDFNDPGQEGDNEPR